MVQAVRAGVSSQTALGSALRAWRGRVSPELAGLPHGGTRRVPGLRRDELASLAQVSVDYVTRLEQGRATRPSPQVLDALAGVLLLSIAERRMLYAFAGAVAPGRGAVPVAVPESADRFLKRWSGTPLAICSPAWDVVDWNDMWRVVLSDPRDWAGRARNLAWRHFTGLDLRVRFDEVSRCAAGRRLIGVLRMTQVNFPHDPELADLIADLCRRSMSFAVAWERFEVTAPSAPRMRLTVIHPEVGPTTLDVDVVTLAGTDLLMVVLSADPASAAEQNLKTLRCSVAGL